MEDLKYLEIGQLKGLLEATGVEPEQPGQFEQLRLGGGLHLVDVVEDGEDCVVLACAHLLILTIKAKEAP